MPSKKSKCCDCSAPGILEFLCAEEDGDAIQLSSSGVNNGVPFTATFQDYDPCTQILWVTDAAPFDTLPTAWIDACTITAIANA
jgi:hypothetical protein